MGKKGKKHLCTLSLLKLYDDDDNDDDDDALFKAKWNNYEGFWVLILNFPKETEVDGFRSHLNTWQTRGRQEVNWFLGLSQL